VDREEINQIIRHMKSSIERFAITIKDLTAIVEVNKESMDGAFEEVDLFEVVEDVKQDLCNLIAVSNARIEVICNDSPWVHFPKKNFRSIIYNLLSNAIKYRSSERSPKVLVKLDRGVDGQVYLSIADNGIGVPDGTQDKMFMLFKRFHNYVEGSGLGLYIVKRMVDNANGEITVSSTLNEGTTFTIILASTYILAST